MASESTMPSTTHTNAGCLQTGYINLIWQVILCNCVNFASMLKGICVVVIFKCSSKSQLLERKISQYG